MQPKIRLENQGSVYEINASLIADHKAKKIAKKEFNSLTRSYSSIYSTIFDEAIASPQILEEWIRSSMTWETLKLNAHLITGSEFSPDLQKTKIMYITETK